MSWRRDHPRCAGCRRRIRNRVHLFDITTREHWHTACRGQAGAWRDRVRYAPRNGALTS